MRHYNASAGVASCCEGGINEGGVPVHHTYLLAVFVINCRVHSFTSTSIAVSDTSIFSSSMV